MIAYFHDFLQPLQKVVKAVQSYLLFSVIFPIFAPCSPFVGLVEKISGVVSLAPDIFLFLFELFSENIWRFQRNTLYLQHPIKLY